MTAKTIFITGAAAGIGAATARLFAQQGWFVGLFDIDEVGLAKLQQELGTQVSMTG
ncbi:MAG TPA: SDR family NAD(P)-dependent oxidoreductase, partial [Agitococcus sp.]|nr:SDR family NAD(P)-dependent oxidoreductase [Agitococcus sp.]